MDIQTATVTTNIYTLKLSDADVGEILADPAQFLAQLRGVRNGNAKERARRMGRKDITIPKERAAHVDGRKPVARAKPEPKACPKCGKLMDPRGLTKHLASCPGKD